MRLPNRLSVFILPAKTARCAALTLGLALPALVPAAICDATYHLQSATQYLSTTQDVNQLGTATVKSLSSDLSDMSFIFDSTGYRIIHSFEGACGTYTAKPIKYRVRNKGEKTLVDGVQNDILVRLFDTNTTLQGYDYKYWFGFASSPDNLLFPIGQTKDENAKFTAWYGTAVFQDSTRDNVSGLWSSGWSYKAQANGPSDSLALAKQILQGWKSEVFDANHKGSFRVQLIKVTYDTVPSPTGVRQSRSKVQRVSGFSVSQNGGQVRITQGKAALAPIQLFDMLGHKVAQLYPTGDTYLWNGRNLQGHAAIGGIYFAESAGKVVGKFLFTP